MEQEDRIKTVRICNEFEDSPVIAKALSGERSIHESVLDFYDMRYDPHEERNIQYQPSSSNLGRNQNETPDSICEILGDVGEFDQEHLAYGQVREGIAKLAKDSKICRRKLRIGASLLPISMFTGMAIGINVGMEYDLHVPLTAIATTLATCSIPLVLTESNQSSKYSSRPEVLAFQGLAKTAKTLDSYIESYRPWRDAQHSPST